MKTVLKFPIYTPPDNRNIMQVPRDFTPRHVDFQDGRLCMWGDGTLGEFSKAIELHVVGTGHAEVTDAMHYIGTVQTPPYVWHIYSSEA